MIHSAGSFLGGWEMVLILAVLVILIGAGHLPASRQVSKEPHSKRADSNSKLDEVILWLAQGLDVGRIPVAPGTFGSVVGLLWFAVLLVPGSLMLYLLGLLLGLAASIWCCGRAEKILGQTDPGSVVLDEIVAMPICFLPWLISERQRLSAMPPLDAFLNTAAWWKTLLIFGLFRLLDVTKPWPVRQSQALPGGWGVTADDVLAAFYVALVSVVFV